MAPGLRRLLALVATVVLVVVGVTAITVGLLAQQSAPQPTATAAATARAATADPGPAAIPGPATVGPVLPRSVPVALDVPAIGVHTPLLQLGLNPDNTIEVPPLAPDSKAGWYKFSPTPGEVGPAVLLGHIDSAAYGPGVFFNLGALRPGDTAAVTRADGTVATFRVDRVETYLKSQFPTLQVYGNTPNAQLRLITCGGDFDPAARSYGSNIVVYASLVSSAPS